MQMRHLFIAAVLMGAVVGCSSSSTNNPPPNNNNTDSGVDAGKPPPPAPDQDARNALKNLNELEKQIWGAKKPPQTPPYDYTKATLGEAVPMKTLTLNDLKAYTAGSDPKPLLIEPGAGAYIYAVYVDGTLRNSITMRYDAQSKGWRESFGNVNTITLVDATVKQLKASGNGDALKLVEAPALYAKFVSNERGDELYVTPLQDVTKTTLKKGVSVKGTDAFAQLQVLAANYQDPSKGDGGAP